MWTHIHIFESSQLKGLYVGDLLYFLAHDRSPPIATENPQCWQHPKMFPGLPWWHSEYVSTCPFQCRGHGFDPWSRKIPHTTEQLSRGATTTEPAHSRAHKLQLLSLCATDPEAHTPRAYAPQQEEPLQGEGHAPQGRVWSTHPQLEKGHTKQWRARAAEKEWTNE